jgi:6-pyruvoyl-tetrahydropterin synthase
LEKIQSRVFLNLSVSHNALDIPSENENTHTHTFKLSIAFQEAQRPKISWAIGNEWKWKRTSIS